MGKSTRQAQSSNRPTERDSAKRQYLLPDGEENSEGEAAGYVYRTPSGNKVFHWNQQQYFRSEGGWAMELPLWQSIQERGVTALYINGADETVGITSYSKTIDPFDERFQSGERPDHPQLIFCDD